MMSSVLVYNIVGSLDEHSLTTLKTSAEIALKVGITQTLLCCLVRDFGLELEVNNVKITADEYLERILSTQHEIQELFPARKCFTLPRPVYDEDLLQNVSKLSEEQLNPEFLTQLNSFKSTLMDLMPAKRVGNANMDGEGIVQVLETAIDLLNTDQIPNLNSTWEDIVNERCKQSHESAFEHFVNNMHRISFDDIVVAIKSFSDVSMESQTVFAQNPMFDAVDNELRIKGLQKIQKECAESITIKQVDIPDLDPKKEVIVQVKEIRQKITNLFGYKRYFDAEVDLKALNLVSDDYNAQINKLNEQNEQERQRMMQVHMAEVNATRELHQTVDAEFKKENTAKLEAQQTTKKLLEQLESRTDSRWEEAQREIKELKSSFSKQLEEQKQINQNLELQLQKANEEIKQLKQQLEESNQKLEKETKRANDAEEELRKEKKKRRCFCF